MDFFSILTLLGGLALFLYGMDEMGTGLKKLSGGQLESILERLTSNRFKGFLLGFAVTAIIQSSSATTVMLVGFVNSGIMKLSQTIGIILGANVGTTVTSWLLSLSGLSGDSFWIKIFKPTSFTPILACVGVLMNMMAKRDRQKNLATILIGFAILMFGMDIMSSAMDGLKDSETFSRILVMFSNPVMGILSGTILTAIIQSSSASIGILQAMSLTGAIPVSTALPIILGQNIGTTITPILSSINGNTGAKRVAVSCLYIKLFGVIIISVAFYAINSIFPFPFMNDYASALTIAEIHTLFNILSTVVLLPFYGFIEKLVCLTIKDKKTAEDQTFAALDERFLSVPSFAIEKCRGLLGEMITLSQKSFKNATDMIQHYNAETAQAIRDSENMVDAYEDKLSSYLVKLASKCLSQEESHSVTKLLHVIGDVERISDHSVNVLGVAEEIYRKNIVFSEEAQHEIVVLTSAVNDIIALTAKVLINDDLELAKQIEPFEEIIDRLKKKMKNNHVQRLQKSECTIEMGFVFADLLANCERASDHCSNIAVCLLEIANDSFETHEYLNHIKNDGDKQFEENYKKYKMRYHL